MSDRVSVPTPSGAVVGRRSADGVAFLGIPYAAAPIGPRRFAPPLPPMPWTGERDAAVAGPAPPQPERPVGAFVHGPTPPTDEDCLTLNVWTPGPSASPRPVLVWIHGGGFTIGWGSCPVYDGARLAARADAVVVTLNYRLGSLGWLHHPDLADGPDGLTGNWGLLDQIAALRWVRESIAVFGGDPSRVTVAGQSAGAICAMDLLVSPSAAGLFARAVVQSPLPSEAVGSPELGTRWAEALAHEVGAVEGVAALRAAPVEAIVTAHERLMGDPAFRGTRGGAAPMPDATIPVHPLHAPGASPDVDVLVGTTADEATFFFRAAGRRPEPDEDGLVAMVAHLPGVDDARVLIDAQREAALAAGRTADTNSLLVRIATAMMVAVPTARWAEARAATGARVHRYRVEHPSPEPGLGALHCVELPLVFGTYDRCAPGERVAGAGPAAAAVSEAMGAAWGRFIHDGDPGWAATSADDPAVAVFGGPAGAFNVAAATVE